MPVRHTKFAAVNERMPLSEPSSWSPCLMLRKLDGWLRHQLHCALTYYTISRALCGHLLEIELEFGRLGCAQSMKRIHNSIVADKALSINGKLGIINIGYQKSLR